MLKKRSKGIIICSVLLFIKGFSGIFSYLSIATPELIPRICLHNPNLANVGISSHEWGATIGKFYNQILMSDNRFVIVTMIILPILSILMLLGAIGILRLQEEWRRILPSIVILNYLFAFVGNIIVVSKTIMVMLIGALLSIQNKEEVSNILAVKFELLQSQVIASAISPFIFPAIIIFFLVHPKVREQFKK